MLACARIGAAAQRRLRRLLARSRSPTASTTPRPRCSITADGGYRRGEVVPLKPAADEAVADDADDRARRRRARAAATTSTMVDGRDHWYHELMPTADADCPAEPMDSEQLLFLLYTSGTTGKPKGIMHTTGGYLTQVAFTHKWVFDLHPDDGHLLVHGRHRLGHRAQLHRLRPAGQRRDDRDVRRRARTIPATTASGRSSRSTA